MTTLQIVRNHLHARVRGSGHPLRLVLGALLTGSGAALFLSDVARWMAGAP